MLTNLKWEASLSNFFVGFYLVNVEYHSLGFITPKFFLKRPEMHLNGNLHTRSSIGTNSV